MGGGAFAQAYAPGEPTLYTPRLSTEQYERLKRIYLAKLIVYFPNAEVRCLIEAPEKPDFGDIDIFMTISDAQEVDFKDLANGIGAAGVIIHSSGNVRKCALGVRIDGEGSEHDAVVYTNAHGSLVSPADASVTMQEHAQIDLEIVSPHLSEWFAFYSSYGDMLGLLGHIVHNLGFTVSDRGLWLRMPELDVSKTMKHANVAHRDGVIFLSNDPHQVMLFLGLSPSKYEARFETLDELYIWLGACRLLSAEAFKLKRDNSSERNRENKRTVFSRFFNEWLPAHLNMALEQDQEARKEKLLLVRREHLQEAIEFFNKQEEYAAKNSMLVRAVNNATAAELLKPIIMEYSQKEGKSLNEVMRACRRNVGFNDAGDPYVLDTSHSDTNSQLYRFLGEDSVSLRDESAARTWARENWEKLKAMERQSKKTPVGVEHAACTGRESDMG